MSSDSRTCRGTPLTPLLVRSSDFTAGEIDGRHGQAEQFPFPQSSFHGHCDGWADMFGGVFQVPRRSGIDLLPGVRNRHPRTLVDQRGLYRRHQPPDPLEGDHMALPPQMTHHLPRAISGDLHQPCVDQPDQFAAQQRLTRGPVIEARSADRKQRALSPDRQFRAAGLHHLSPPDAHRTGGFGQKIVFHQQRASF